MASAKLPRYIIEERADDVRALADVERVDWSHELAGVADAWLSTQGEGVTVAVLDTGVDRRHYEAGELAGRVKDLRSFVPSQGAYDQDGHGTHVASILAANRDGGGIIGIAPACKLVVGKVLTEQGGAGEWIAAGIDWAVERGAEVISLSLGSRQPIPVVNAAIARANQRGAFVVAAAGNSRDYVAWPAALGPPSGDTLAIGSIRRDGAVSDFSGRGKALDFVAPGERIVGAWLRGTYATISGTSMAAPFFAGALALAVAHHKGREIRGEPIGTPLKTYRHVREHFARTAIDGGAAGRDDLFGRGILNLRDLLDDPTPGASGMPSRADLRLAFETLARAVRLKLERRDA